MLHVHCFTFNFIQENTYVVFDDLSREALIIDAGNQYPQENEILFRFIAENNLIVTRLLNTHAHIDHILGNEACFGKYGLLPEIHALDMFTFEKTIQSSMLWGVDLKSSPVPQTTLTENGIIPLGKEQLHIIFTPGHAQGHVSFYHPTQNILISGDVIFYHSIGRTDLPGGNMNTLVDTIQNKIYTLPLETTIYSGHGQPTTVKEERLNNPYVAI